MTGSEGKLAPDAKDAGHLAIRAGLSMIPVVGGPALELFNHFFAQPVGARRDEWMQDIAARLHDIEQKTDGPTFEKLSQDESFVTVLMNATQIAVRTHRDEKLQALRNAVMNAALGKFPDDDLRAIMLNLVERLTPLHMSVLCLMQDPSSRADNSVRSMGMGGLDDVVTASVPALRGSRDLLDLVWRDLVDSGLLTNANLHTTMSGGGLRQKRTTELGDNFLEFVSPPEL